MSKTDQGFFFEDFRLGLEIHHATPRTVTEGDVALYVALTGSRFAIHCSDILARMAGLPRRPLEDLLTFHLAFGRLIGPEVTEHHGRIVKTMGDGQDRGRGEARAAG